MKHIFSVSKVNEIYHTKYVASTLKILFLIGSVVYIGYVVYSQKGFNESFANAWYSIIIQNNLYLIPLVLLMFLNWSLEAIKWKQLLVPLQPISFFKSIVAVISGVTLSFITMGGVGDYLGRAMYVTKTHLKSLVGITLAGGVYQNLVTYFAGGIGVVLFLEFQSSEIFYSLWSLLLLLFGITFYLVFRIHLLSNVTFLKPFTEALVAYKLHEKFYIFTLSLSRYIIILLQYYLILKALQIQLSIIDFFTGISLMLLLKSVIPRFSFLSDLGIREFSALLFFTKVGLEPATIISSTLMLWVLNVLTPAIGGLYFIMNMK